MKNKLMKFTASILVAVMLIGIAPITEIKGLSDIFSIKTYAATGDYEYTVSGSNATITKYTGTASGVSVTTPKTLGGYNVTEIGNNAFEGCNIGTVTVSEGVKKICQCAFKDCVYLTTVSFKYYIYRRTHFLRLFKTQEHCVTRYTYGNT